jgi:hypothetical protein
VDDEVWEGNWEIRTFDSKEEITDGESVGEFQDRFKSFDEALAGCGGGSGDWFYTIGKVEDPDDYPEWVATVTASGIVTEVTDSLYFLPKKDRTSERLP